MKNSHGLSFHRKKKISRKFKRKLGLRRSWNLRFWDIRIGQDYVFLHLMLFFPLFVDIIYWIQQYLIFYTGCSLKIVFFPENFVIFLNSASSAAVGFQPAWCMYTHWHRGKTESRIFFKNRKDTIFNEHLVAEPNCR